MPRKIIIDTDPGQDDAVAILLALGSPAEIEVLGIVAVAGNVGLKQNAYNALQVVELSGKTGVPVYAGCEAPIRRKLVTAEYVHGKTGLDGPTLPAPKIKLRDQHGVDFIIDTVRANPGEVTLVAVGRMTNLALALKHDPEIATLVKDVVIMGGNFYVPGNVSPVAEANIHGDPEAADVVMTAAWKVVVVGLDVTAVTIMSRSYLADMAKVGGKDVQLLNDLSQSYIDFYKHAVEDGMMVHDSCACVYVVAPELFSIVTGPVRVVCGGIADGQTIVKPDGMRFPPGDWDDLPSQIVCTGIESEKVIDLISDTILRRV